MNSIKVRYGESLALDLETDDATDEKAVLTIGKAGKRPKIKKEITLTEGKGTFNITQEDTRICIGEYLYQVNVIGGGVVTKFPSPECQGDGLPAFIVYEALDEEE